MKIDKFDIDKDCVKKGIQTNEPFLRLFPNQGCGLKDCHCSDGWKLSLSDGKIGLLVTFDDEDEFNTLLGRN